MTITLDTQNLQEYPGIIKRVTLDQTSLVPLGEYGDEKYLLSFSTTAYSDNVTRTRIQDFYVTDFKAGWCKSSGFLGSNFALDSTHNSLEIKIDSTVSGISDGYYRITLDHDNGVYIDGEVVAADMEAKIRAIADTLPTADLGYRLAYMNATVEFVSGRFWIISGSVSKYYTGTNKSSVRVRASSVNDCSELLGFNLSTDSETLDSVNIKEALVLNNYTVTPGTGQITISANIGAATNDCMVITDNTNTDYFQITSVSGGTTIYFDGTKVANNYTANGAKVQLLRAQDPDADPTLWYSDIDKICRLGIRTMISQIDYSS